MVFLVREAAASGIVCCWRGREYILLSPRFQSNCPSLTPAAIRHQQKRQSRGIGLCVCVFDPGAVQRPSETLICAVPQTKNTHYQSTGAHAHTHIQSWMRHLHLIFSLKHRHGLYVTRLRYFPLDPTQGVLGLMCDWCRLRTESESNNWSQSRFLL